MENIQFKCPNYDFEQFLVRITYDGANDNYVLLINNVDGVDKAPVLSNKYFSFVDIIYFLSRERT